jgi:hypothetical protein
MSTAFDIAVDAPAVEPDAPAIKPGSRAAVRAYRESILAGDDFDATIAFAASRIRREWEADARRHKARCEAARALAEVVPQLEAEVHKARQALQQAEAPIGDDVTVGRLRELIRPLAPKLPLATRPDLAQGLTVLAGEILSLRGKLMQAERQLSHVRDTNERVLLETTGVDVPGAVKPILAQIDQVQQRMQARVPMLRASEAAEKQRAYVEGLASGAISPPAAKYETLGQRASKIKRLYLRQRRRLDSLFELAGHVPDAQAADARDREELAALQARAREVRADAIEKATRPENMKWVGAD